MRRMLIILTTVVLTVLANWQGKGETALLTAEEQALTTERQALAAEKQTPAAAVTPQDSRHHEATLTDATQLYRVCSSRPQRLIPTQGSKTERTPNPCLQAGIHITKTLQSPHDSRRRLETAPFCLSASCHYYVIALRHIIR